jgi:hypothetical protein
MKSLDESEQLIQKCVKKAVATLLIVIVQHLPRETEKNHKNSCSVLFCVWPIGARQLPNKSQKRYRLN